MTTAETPQNMVALEEANRIRFYRVELKRKIERGEKTPQEIILSGDPDVRTMKIYDLLLAQPMWGKSRVRKLMASVPIRDDKQIIELTDRQKEELCQKIPSTKRPW